MKIHHIGYLVKKLEKAAAAFEGLGFCRTGDVTRDEGRGADILFLEKDGYQVELISPFTPESVVAGLIKTYKNAPYHLCYEAQDFEADGKWLEENGYTRIGEPMEAPAIGGRKVVFYLHPAAGMLELLQQAAK